MSFPPFILPRSTVYNYALTTTVQSVVEPCNIAVYLHSDCNKIDHNLLVSNPNHAEWF